MHRFVTFLKPNVNVQLGLKKLFGGPPIFGGPNFEKLEKSFYCTKYTPPNFHNSKKFFFLFLEFFKF